MPHVKDPSTKEDMFAAIQESWNYVGEEYCTKSSLKELGLIKIRGGATKYQW